VGTSLGITIDKTSPNSLLVEDMGTFEEVEKLALRKANNHFQTNKNKMKGLKRKFPVSPVSPAGN
jgi:hypothetical protein